MCQKPAISGFTHTGCLTTFSPERLIVPFTYQNAVRQAILSGKFGMKSFYLFDYLVSLCLEYFDQTSVGFGEEAIVVPITLHTKKQSKRGFNQSEVIASALAKRLGLKIDRDTLVRVRHSSPQSTLGKTGRLQNVKDAFLCKDKSLAGKDIILVDDVCTTGSTLLSAAKALKQAGARFVWCFALARA